MASILVLGTGMVGSGMVLDLAERHQVAATYLEAHDVKLKHPCE